MRLRTAFLVLLLGLSPGPPAAAQDWQAWRSIFADFFLGPEVKAESRWQGRVARGRRLEVKGVNGFIQAEPALGGEAQVVALRRGRRHDPHQVEVRVLEHDGGVTVCAVYPSPDPARPNECLPGQGGRMNVRNNDVSVEFTVRVPAGVGLLARTVNGSVRASGLDADVEAFTVNGGVDVSTSGRARAETVNGSIRARLGRADWTDTLDFKTVNGGIAVALPGDASTTVQAETVNGGITSEFTLTHTVRATRRALSGTIGQGGRQLALRTVNGSIRLRRSP